MKKVLAIDGGGIRGIIPAMVLAEIERRTGKRIAEMFDLIAGTSTGGILALGLTKPEKNGGAPQYSAEKLVELYEKQGGKIFSRSVWHRIHAVGNLADEKYPKEGIESILKEYFEDCQLADALTEVVVPAYDLENRISWFFKRWHALKQEDQNVRMWEVARATSAAPTYFEPLPLTIDSTSYAFVDGGVFANNPAMCAYVEASRLYGKEDSDFLVVSLGTGELIRKLPFDEVKDWGLVKWAQPILDVVFDGVSDTVDYQLRELLATDGDNRRYYRFQTPLDIGMDDMDDASQTNIYALKAKAGEIIDSNEAALDSLCTQLSEGLRMSLPV